MNKTSLTALAVLLIVVASGIGYYFYAPQPGPSLPTTPKAPSRIVRSGVWPLRIDPCLIFSDMNSEVAIHSIYDSIVFLDWTTVEPKPFIATKWDISKDGLVYTFYLRNDVKFHDGTMMTAEDVKFSIDRMLIMGKGYAFSMLPYIDKVEITDNYTIVVRLKKSCGIFLNLLSNAIKVLNKKLVTSHIEKTGEYGDLGDFGQKWLLTNDAGSGPYYVDSFILESKLATKKFKDYWSKDVHPNMPDELWTILVDAEITQRTLYMNRELEFNNQFGSRENAERLAEIPGVQIVDMRGSPANKGQWGPIAVKFHMTKPPMDDIHLRKAFAYAFDYEQFNLKLSPGYGPPAERADWRSRKVDGFGTVGIPGALSAPKDMQPAYDRDMNKAVEELRQSKYFRDGTLSKYAIDCDWTAEVPDREKMAILFASSVNELADRAGTSIDIKIVKVPWLQCKEKWSKNETSPCAMVYPTGYQAYFGDIGGIMEYFMSWTFPTTSSNYWLYNKTVDDMFLDAMATVDRNERLAKYAPLQRYLWSQCCCIFMGMESWPIAYQKAYIDWYVPEKKVYPYLWTMWMDFRYIGMYPEKKGPLLKPSNPIRVGPEMIIAPLCLGSIERQMCV